MATILKVSVETGCGAKQYIGFVEIAPRVTTLAQLRTIISRTLDVDSVPVHYQFVRGDGLLVGSRGEHGIPANRFLPCVTLMPILESPIAAQVKVVLWTGATFKMWALPTCTLAQLRTESSRFWGLNPADTLLTDDEGASWPDAALVHDVLAEVQRAVRSFLQVGGDVAQPPLEDAAQQAAASALPFILRLRDATAERAIDPRGFKSQGRAGGAQLHHPQRRDSSGGESAAAGGGEGGVQPQQQLQTSENWDGGGDEAAASSSFLLLADGLADDPYTYDDFASTAEGVDFDGGSSEDSGPQYGARAASPEGEGSDEEEFADDALDHGDRVAEPGPLTTSAAEERLSGFAAIEPRLWRVFTWYACAGDATDPFHIRARQWRCLLDDCGLLMPENSCSGLLTPEAAHIVFSVAVSRQAWRQPGGGTHATGALGGHPGFGIVAGLKPHHIVGTADSPVGLSYVQFLRSLVAVAVRLGMVAAPDVVAAASPSAASSRLVQQPSEWLDVFDCRNARVESFRGDRHSAAVFAMKGILSVREDEIGLSGDEATPALTSRRLRSDVAIAVMNLIENSVVPYAGCWNVDAWRAEVLQLEAISTERAAAASPQIPASRVRSFVDAESVRRANSAVSGVTSAAAVLSEFAPALRPLFDFYASLRLETGLPMGGLNHGVGGAESPVDSVAEHAPSPRGGAMFSFMDHLRVHAASARSLQYDEAASVASSSTSPGVNQQLSPSQPIHPSVSKLQAAVGVTVAAASSSSTGSYAQAASARRREAAAAAVVATAAAAAKSRRSGTGTVNSNNHRQMQPPVARVLGTPSSQPFLPRQGALSSPKPDTASMGFAAFSRLVADLRLHFLCRGVIPARRLAAIFLASAAGAGVGAAPAVSSAITLVPQASSREQQQDTDGLGSSRSAAAAAWLPPEPLRLCLSFPQFLECLGRMALHMGGAGATSAASESQGGADAAAVGVSEPPFMACVRVKALLQSLEKALDAGKSLVIAASRKDTSSASQNSLMTCAIALHAAFARLSLRDAVDSPHSNSGRDRRQHQKPVPHVAPQDYCQFLSAFLRQAARNAADSPSAMRSDYVHTPAAILDGTPSTDASAMGFSDADYAARAAALVEGRDAATGARLRLSDELRVAPPWQSRQETFISRSYGGSSAVRTRGKAVYGYRRGKPLAQHVLSPLSLAIDSESTATNGSAPLSGVEPAATAPAPVSLHELGQLWRDRKRLQGLQGQILLQRQAELRTLSQQHALLRRVVDTTPLEDLASLASATAEKIAQQHDLWAQLLKARALADAAIVSATDQQRALRRHGHPTYIQTHHVVQRPHQQPLSLGPQLSPHSQKQAFLQHPAASLDAALLQEVPLGKDAVALSASYVGRLHASRGIRDASHGRTTSHGSRVRTLPELSPTAVALVVAPSSPTSRPQSPSHRHRRGKGGSGGSGRVVQDGSVSPVTGGSSGAATGGGSFFRTGGGGGPRAAGHYGSSPRHSPHKYDEEFIVYEEKPVPELLLRKSTVSAADIAGSSAAAAVDSAERRSPSAPDRRTSATTAASATARTSELSTPREASSPHPVMHPVRDASPHLTATSHRDLPPVDSAPPVARKSEAATATDAAASVHQPTSSLPQSPGRTVVVPPLHLGQMHGNASASAAAGPHSDAAAAAAAAGSHGEPASVLIPSIRSSAVSVRSAGDGSARLPTDLHPRLSAWTSSEVPPSDHPAPLPHHRHHLAADHIGSNIPPLLESPPRGLRLSTNGAATGRSGRSSREGPLGALEDASVLVPDASQRDPIGKNPLAEPPPLEMPRRSASGAALQMGAQAAPPSIIALVPRVSLSSAMPLVLRNGRTGSDGSVVSVKSGRELNQLQTGPPSRRDSRSAGEKVVGESTAPDSESKSRVSRVSGADGFSPSHVHALQHSHPLSQRHYGTTAHSDLTPHGSDHLGHVHQKALTYVQLSHVSVKPHALLQPHTNPHIPDSIERSTLLTGDSVADSDNRPIVAADVGQPMNPPSLRLVVPTSPTKMPTSAAGTVEVTASAITAAATKDGNRPQESGNTPPLPIVVLQKQSIELPLMSSSTDVPAPAISAATAQPSQSNTQLVPPKSPLIPAGSASSVKHAPAPEPIAALLLIGNAAAPTAVPNATVPPAPASRRRSVDAVPPAPPIDDVVVKRLVYKRLLQTGGLFTKFGRRGYPHKRMVGVTEDGAHVAWADPGSGKPRVTASHESLAVDEITDVIDGPGGSDVFARNVRYIKRPECCFSVVTPSRTLDLEAESPEVKKEWLTAFMCLRKYRRGI